jgi:hypothetical protein
MTAAFRKCVVSGVIQATMVVWIVSYISQTVAIMSYTTLVHSKNYMVNIFISYILIPIFILVSFSQNCGVNNREGYVGSLSDLVCIVNYITLTHVRDV